MDELTRLKSENRRYKDALKTIYVQAVTLPGHTIRTIAAQALSAGCPPTCNKKHSVAELAELESITAQAIYKLQSKRNLKIEKGMVRHDEFRDCRFKPVEESDPVCSF